MENDKYILDSLLTIFDSLFQSLETKAFSVGGEIFLTIITPILTLVIMFWAGKKIREGDFKIPSDVIEIVIFLLMIVFCNTIINNQTFYEYIVSVLDIPADLIKKFVFTAISDNVDTNITIGERLSYMLNDIFNKATEYAIPQGVKDGNILKKLANIFNPEILLNIILWGVYVFFGLILFTSIIITYILTYLQIAFWKIFAVIMIPLLYFKITRGMVFFWTKTIIALSLIQTFVLVVGGFNSIVENNLDQLFENKDDNGISFALVTAFIVGKLISIAFLKEIPAMINGMLGTQSAQSTGAFANSFVMTTIGATTAGAAFGAVRGATVLGRTATGVARTAGSGIASSSAGQAVTGSSAYKIISAGASSVKKGINNITSGKSWNTGKK